MNKKITRPLFCCILIPVLFLFVSTPSSGAQTSEGTIPPGHHLELVERPRCTECHTDSSGAVLKSVDRFNHGSSWYRDHRFYASSDQTLCTSCHRQSFCSDCHSYKNKGIKPSERFSGSPERWLPHRGNYLFRHRIDARIDPAPCFRCHGRQNNRLCTKCHK